MSLNYCRIKNYFYIVIALVFVTSPVFARAAFNDVTLETTAIINVGGYDLTVYSASALLEEIVVDVSTFSVTMLASSVIIVESADGVGFTHDASGGFVTSEYCSGGISRLGLAGAAGTVTITPSGVCVEAVAEDAVVEENERGTSSSHRRLSEESPITPPTSTPTANTSLLDQLRALVLELISLGGSVPDSVLNLLGLSTSGDTSTNLYTRNLTLEDTGPDVSKLQAFLIKANTGPSARALANVGATGLFGPLTEQALAEYQAFVGLTPAVGYFGPKTRAHLQSIGEW